MPYSQPGNRYLCMLWASSVGGASGGNRFLPLHLKQNVHAEEPLRDELAFCDDAPLSVRPSRPTATFMIMGAAARRDSSRLISR